MSHLIILYTYKCVYNVILSILITFPNEYLIKYHNYFANCGICFNLTELTELRLHHCVIENILHNQVIKAKILSFPNQMYSVSNLISFSKDHVVSFLCLIVFIAHFS